LENYQSLPPIKELNLQDENTLSPFKVTHDGEEPLLQG
jgi:hypothetical protein